MVEEAEGEEGANDMHAIDPEDMILSKYRAFIRDWDGSIKEVYTKPEPVEEGAEEYIKIMSGGGQFYEGPSRLTRPTH